MSAGYAELYLLTAVPDPHSLMLLAEKDYKLRKRAHRWSAIDFEIAGTGRVCNPPLLLLSSEWLRVTVPSLPPITRQGTRDTKQESEHEGM